MKNTQKTLRAGDEILYYKEGTRAAPEHFIHPANVILVHGFTATSDYLSSIAEDLNQLGLNVFIFNYNSYKGIDRAAVSFFHILEGLDKVSGGKISDKNIAIVAHSMGGLVARALCQFSRGGKYISGIFTIGSPHDGALTDSKYLGVLVKYYESIAGSGAPKGYRKDCRSMLQLMKKDNGRFLLQLNRTQNKLSGISLGSISGGKQFLEISTVGKINKYLNKLLQSWIGHDKNDGLITETSSDWSRNMNDLQQNRPLHINNYPEFLDLNHSYLINNQSVSLEVASFIKNLFP